MAPPRLREVQGKRRTARRARRWPWRRLFAIAAGAVLLAACAPSGPSPLASAGPTPAATRGPAPTASAGAPAVATMDDLAAILRGIGADAPAAAQHRVDELWGALEGDGRVPLVLGNDVVFLYRGEADQVHWRGSFNAWSEPGLAGTRIGSTDLWVASTTFPEGSRVEYKIVRDGTDWLADPANPATSFSGLAGVTSVLAMPGFEVTDVSRERSDAPAGRLEAAKSISSSHLGYPVEYWVYTPAGYDALDRLATLYLLDGNDFVDERMGALPAVLDSLIADGRIPPLVAVFVDAREPGNPDHNRREEEFLAHPVEHARFIAEELVPAIDGAYRTARDPDARAIAGVSFGGVAATFIGVAENDTFHNLAAFSPSLWVIDSPASLPDAAKSAGAKLMAERLGVVTACGEASDACPAVRIFLSGGIPEWDVGDLTGLAGVLEKTGYAVDFHKVREGHTWDQWRGLADEMLAFLFSTPAARA